MNIGFIAVIGLAGFGLFCLISPKSATRADKRDDPEAVGQIRKAGLVLIGAAAAAMLYVIKYTVF